MASVGLLPVSSAAYAVTATTTSLAISSTTVPYKTPITLTATVTAGGSPVTTGTVLFCDATAAYCENNAAQLARVSLNASTGTATVKIGSGPLGVHSYKVVYRANNLFDTSTSNTVSYTVQGTYGSATALASSGSVGNYTLSTAVTGVGAITSPGPSGTVTFRDTSAGNNTLGTRTLTGSVLTNTFAQANGSPFSIGNSTADKRSTTISSAYLNGDNNLDVISADGTGVSVMLGNGDGSFQAPMVQEVCATVSSSTNIVQKIVLGDFNRDGVTDAAIGCNDKNASGGLAVLLGNGDGTFQSPQWLTTGSLYGLDLGDFNNDGLLDIVLTNQTQQNVQVMLGNGDGSFQAPTTVVNTPYTTNNVVVADFDGDGRDDLAYAVRISSSIQLSNLYVALGNGDGTFQSPQLQASSIGEFLTAGDTNKDSIPDLVSATVTLRGTNNSYIANSLYVLIGTGTGTFQLTTYLSDIPSDPHLADVDADGNADIIAGGSYGALVYHGNGDGTFQSYDEPVIGGFTLTYAVNAGDYNNDGNADLIGTDANNWLAAVALSQVSQSADASALTGVAVYPLGSGVHNVDAQYSGDSIYTASGSSTVQLLAAPVSTTLQLGVSPAVKVARGQSVTLTATLSPYTVGPPTTTTDAQTVSFYNGSTLVGTGTLASGVATLMSTTLPAGTLSLKAVYGGDSNYLTSTSNTTSLTVSDIQLVSSPNPSTYGQLVTLTATVSAGATGTVQFYDGTTLLGSSAIASSTATFSLAALSTGSHTLTAVYSGDSTHVSVTSAAVTQVVNKSNPIMSVSTSGQSTYLATVTITATLPSDATGTVTFTSGSLTLGTATIASGAATVTTTALPVGNNTITASYAGDTNYNAKTATTTQEVIKATPATALTSSLNPSTYGSSVTLTNTLTSTVTGTVTFKSDATVIGTVTVNNGVATLTTSTLAVGLSSITATYSGDTNYVSVVATLPQVVDKAQPTLALASSANPSLYSQSIALTATLPAAVTGTVVFSEGATTLGTVTISSGVATLNTAVLAVGSHTITASYSGDGNYLTASSTVSQVVNKVNTATALVSSSNPSTYGDSVTLTATVSNASSVAMTGTVSFSNGATALGTVALSGGTAALTTTALPTGSDTITAAYNGDGNTNTSSATLVQAVQKITASLTLASSLNPATVGQSVTFTATVPAAATGTVSFSDGATTLGTATVTGGVASFTTSSLNAGGHSMTANYSGDTNYSTASGNLTETVSKRTPSVTVITSGPSTYGQSVTLTATLPAGVTGTVSFSSGALSLGVGTINASGVASVDTTILPVGSNTITASYAGDSNNNNATGSATQTVSKASPTVTVTTPGPSTYGSSVTITATVPTTATGTVTFTEGSTTIGTGTVNNGVATITTTTLPVGSTTITATYSGDSNNNGATGSTTQTVNKATVTLALNSSQNPSSVNQPVTFTATLPTTVTGSVTFTDGATTIGTAALASGVATITTATLTSGSHTITASYAGDGNYNSTSANLTQVVNLNSTTVTVTTSGPSSYGGSVTITATVPTGATGTVTFTSGSTTIGTGTINPATGTVSVTTSTLPAGSNTITASYSGDTSYSPATGSTTQTVSKVTPPITVTAIGGSSYGETVTITTTLPAGTTGTVTLTSGGTTIGTGTVSAGGTVVITTTALPIGSNTITATYSGDTNHNGTTGSTTYAISKASVAVSLVSSLNPSTYGQSVTFTAGVPTATTGTITFFDGSNALGTVAVANGQASVMPTTLVTGTHTIAAVYNGDGNYNGATSSPLSQVVNKLVVTLPAPGVSGSNVTPGTPVTITEQVPAGVTGPVTFWNGSTALGTVPVVGGVATLTVSSLPSGTNSITASVDATDNTTAATSPATTVTVGKYTPTVTLTSSLNPSTYGQTVVLTASVPSAGTAAVPAAPTGTVTFSDGSTIIGTGTVYGGGATLTISSLTAGTHVITASYGGDSSYNTASSSPLSQVVNKASPTLPAPGVSNPTQTYGGTQTITETVPTGVSGPVTFYSGSTVIGTAPVVGGVATITVTTLPVGSNPITATTPGDANNNPATSPATTVTVTKTTPVLPAPIVSDANPNPNTPVTITENVPTGVTGTITFSNGSTVLGTATIVNGTATLTVPSLPIGSNPITASVAETATSNAATSPATTVTVGLIVPTVTLSSSVNPSVYSQAVTFTASLPTAATGSITFLDGATVLGTGVLAGGVATLTTSTLAIGTHGITASYGGDTAYKPATSASLAQVVGKLPTTITLTVSAGTTLVQSPITLMAVVAASTPTPTGIVTFLEGTTVLGTAALSGTGVVGLQLSGNAALSLSSLSSGSHSITAVYGGDATFLTSTSAPVTAVVHDFTNKNTGAASQEAYPGDTVSYTFTLTPVGNNSFLQNVTLAVDGLPANATYTLSPTSVASGAAATQVTLTVKTSTKLNTTTSSNAMGRSSSIAFALLGLFGLGAVRRYRRRMPRLLMALLLLAGSLLPLAALSGCAGGYYAPKPSNYTVTVTGTEGALVRSATATLVVEQ